eukprot:CAMPEP_0198258396 /NCGR_PEP_ID=MMETSP1447-20131203/7845_1 /TAXON_ID=420782 /ORGANISM="Chaetoceros dichaeta, Strain CCMP1751" /LENGTH=255 /DNA_ID=CAMNT_0043945513 /DNA_START=17 /DNA_END=781 /DNA_ORIENTATION=+
MAMNPRIRNGSRSNNAIASCFILTTTLVLLSNCITPSRGFTLHTPPTTTTLSSPSSANFRNQITPTPTTTTKLTATPIPSSGNNFSQTSTNPITRYDLTSQFSRWTFLQSILSDELTTPSDVNQILYLVLRSFLDNPRPVELPNGKSNPSPQLSAEQIVLVRDELLGVVDGDGRRVIVGMPVVSEEEAYLEVGLVETWKLLERLQPDKDNYEQEDAYKCCWDVVSSLYGEESVKLEQEGGETRSWVVRSGVVRLL